jgi:hypothetical protein
MKSTKILLVIILASAFLISFDFSQAALNQGYPAFNLTQFTYSPSQPIEGFLNFSLSNESANSVIRANVTKTGVSYSLKEMSIQDFLRNSSVTFECSQNCLISYSTIGSPEPTIIDTINVGEKYYGLLVTGMNPEVLNLTFKISGTNTGNHVCGESPIRMDLLNDGTIDYEFSRPSENEWCFELRSSNCLLNPTQEAELESTAFCQKFSLKKTGKLNVSAKLRFKEKDPEEGTGPGENEIGFFVYDKNAIRRGNCSVEYFPSETYSLASCVISSYDDEENPTGFYLDKTDDYFICVRAKLAQGSTAAYYIKKESNQNLCGFYGIPTVPLQQYTEDYEIYAKESKFSPFYGDSTFNEQTKIGETALLTYVNNYIDSRYNSNCTYGCVIPLRFISKIEQDLTLSNLELKFRPQGQSTTTDTNFYHITANYPKINLARQAIPLTALNITAPDEQATNYRILIQFNQNSLGSIAFKVEPVPIIQSLSPLTAIPGQPTTFTVVAIPSPSGGQIVNYTWNFGDGIEETTPISRATHTYSSGTFNLLVKAIDSSGRIGTKVFIITTSLSKDGLNASYLRKRQLLSNMSLLQLDWYGSMVYNLSQINDSLNSVQTQLNSANPDLNYIKSQLDSIKIPVSVSTSFNLPESSYVPDTQKINLDYLEDLGAGTYSDAEATKNAINTWQDDVTFSLGLIVKKITFDDNSNQEISIFTLRANSQEDIYSVFELPSTVSVNQVKIKESIEPYEFTNALGFNSSGSFSVSLALPAKTETSSINFYASPAFSSLSLENPINPPVTKKSSILLPVLLAVLIIIVVIVFIFLVWKKKGSSSDVVENSNLFENPGDDINLVNYVQSSLSQGKSQPEIEQELLSQGWNKKQIDYAFKHKDNQGIEPEPAFNY